MPGPSWPQPLGPTYIRYLEGPTDPEVGVLCVQSLSARPIALILHHTGHPVNVFPQAVISADWPGAWAEGGEPATGMERKQGLSGLRGRLARLAGDESSGQRVDSVGLHRQR